MFENLQIFRLAAGMAAHAGARQALVARNLANADTPGYRPRDLPAFRTLLDETGPDAGLGLRATRPGHFGAAAAGPALGAAVRIEDGETDPNGNGVSLETEMVRAVDIRRDHERALAIYKFSLDVLRSAVARR